MCKSQTSSLEHLLVATHFSNGLLVMISTDGLPSLYWDDSGTHEDSPIAVAAAYVVDTGQIASFEKDWGDAKADEGFQAFHMTDFNGFHDEFADPKWRDDDKRKRTLNRLICIAKTRSRFCAGAVVDRAAYSEVILSDPILKKMCGNYAYTFAVSGCLRHIAKWRETHAPNRDLKYIFDQMSRGKGEIMNIFGDYLKMPNNTIGTLEDGFSFESKKKVLELQAADILAWHLYQHFCEHELRGLPIRRETSILMDMPNEVSYFRRETLQEFRAGMILNPAYRRIAEGK